MTNDKPITCLGWMRGSDEPIQDQSLVAKADYISVPQSVMDKDIFQDRLDKSDFNYEAIYPSKSGKAWNAFRVDYAKDYGLDEPLVGLTI